MNNQNQPAFPTYPTHRPGMTMRQYYKAHAPFTIQDAKEMFGDRDASLAQDEVRRGVLLMLAMMRDEYADTMEAEDAAKAKPSAGGKEQQPDQYNPS